jgi:hypothetical protein
MQLSKGHDTITREPLSTPVTDIATYNSKTFFMRGYEIVATKIE